MGLEAARLGCAGLTGWGQMHPSARRWGGRDTPVPTKCFLSKRAGGDLRRMPESWRSGRGRPNASSLLKPDVKAEKFGESQMFGGSVGDTG